MLADGLRGVCFDIGGTLTRMDRGALATEIAALVGSDVKTVRDLLIKHGKRRRTTAGELAEVITRECSCSRARSVLTKVLERRRREISSPLLHPDALPVLHALCRDGWRIFYLSNSVGFTGEDPRPEYFSLAEAVLHSWQTGWCKPEREAFRAVETAARLSPPELVFVGDSLTADILGALRAGWSAVYVRRTGAASCEVPGVPVISTLADLPALLDLRRGGRSTPCVRGGPR